MHEHQQHQANGDQRKPFWKTPLGWAFIGFTAIAGYFLITEHTAHTISFLPWLLLLACPLMHIFGHGHGGHGGHGGHKRDNSDDPDKPAGNDGKSAHQR
jgi:hypothetical protein